jgi:type III pantothenate kinase
MLLAIDIGNTNVKYALYDGVKQVALWRAASERKRTGDEHAAFLAQCLGRKNIAIGDITASIVVSVVPEITPHVLAGIEYLTGKAPLHAGEANAPIAVECLTDRPQEVGRDLLVSIVAARALHKGPLLVVGFGTATTFSVVDAEGRFRGAAIAPGVVTSYSALQQAASKLPPVVLAAPPAITGTNTVHAMQSGIYYGTISMVEGMIARMAQSVGPFETVITCGGLARLFENQINGVTAIEPDLTLTGLMLVYESTAS